MAILPANVLISDPASGWLKVGAPIVVQQDLVTAHTLIAGFAVDEAGATQNGATRLLRITLESRNGGIHIEAATVNNTTHKVIKTDTADASPASMLLPALNSLAKKLDSYAVDFPTKNEAAVEALAAADASNNPQQRAQYLNQAINQDQNLGLAWTSLMDMIPLGRKADLKRMIDDAKTHRAAFSALDRARFDMSINRLEGAPPAEQIKAANAVLTLAPNDLDVLTVLGNNQILQGDSAAGEESLRRAARLNPGNPELRFQLARGLMELRKYKEAEGVFNSIDKSPSVYPELATCILLEGDKKRADTVADKFFASVQNEELRPLLHGAWQVMSGERQKGVDLVLNTKFKTPNLQAIALGEVTVWQLMGGDFDGAKKTVALLVQTGGQSVALPEIAALLDDKTTPIAAWQGKVQSLSLPENVKQPILAYGFFLRGNYDDAARVWQQVNDATHGEDLHARVMLASSLDRAGKPTGGRVMVLPFTPEFADLYSAVSFTELRRLLAKG